MKPLKAPKKEKKDLDPDDIAFKEKQKAGKSTHNCIYVCSYVIYMVFLNDHQWM